MSHRGAITISTVLMVGIPILTGMGVYYTNVNASDKAIASAKEELNDKISQDRQDIKELQANYKNLNESLSEVKSDLKTLLTGLGIKK